MIENDKWKELLKYIAQNNYSEDSYLSPFPTHVVECIGLLNKIAELRGISEEQNGEEFNTIVDSIEPEEDDDMYLSI